MNRYSAHSDPPKVLASLDGLAVTQRARLFFEKADHKIKKSWQIGIKVAGLRGQNEPKFESGSHEGREMPELRSSGFESIFNGCLDPRIRKIVP